MSQMTTTAAVKIVFHTRQEFAALLRCSLRSLDRLAHTDPTFPPKLHVGGGRATRYAREAVERYIANVARDN